jgi:hypothetical protein
LKASLEIQAKKSASKDFQFLIFTILAIVLAFALCYESYSFQAASGFNSLYALGSLIFWGAILALVFRFPLRKVTGSFSSFVAKRNGLAIFIVYMGIHLLVYGFILETIITTVSGASTGLTFQPYVGVFSELLTPASFGSILVSLFLYPNITLVILPFLGASLALYSIAMAGIIGVLVVTNIMKALDLRNVCSKMKKSTAFVAMPIIGVVGGASCCLSLPLFVSLLAPGVILSFPYEVAYYVTYFVFPPATVLALRLNLNSIDKISKKITRKSPDITK